MRPGTCIRIYHRPRRLPDGRQRAARQHVGVGKRQEPAVQLCALPHFPGGTPPVPPHPTFLEARRQFLLSQLTALAVKEALELWTDDIRIKWPNDIYWKEKKICGLLIENELSAEGIARSIIGIGLNVNQEIFHSDAPNPVSLRQITGLEKNPMEVLTYILTYTRRFYEGLRNDKDGTIASLIARQYDLSLFRREGWHPYEDASGRFIARLLRVEEDGRYILQDEAGNERGYLFKEVQYIL